MFGSSKRPLDRFRYLRDVDSRPLRSNELPGDYVYVVDLDETIHVAPNGPHMHPKVLGNAGSALYAGEISIAAPGEVDSVNNSSGTFRFKSQQSLCCVVLGLVRLGFRVHEAIWYTPDGSMRPQRLNCPALEGSP